MSKNGDVVDRLQEILDGPIPLHLSRQDVRDVAAEIQQLRDLVELLGEALLSETTGGFTAIFDTTQAALDAWQEARRG